MRCDVGERGPGGKIASAKIAARPASAPLAEAGQIATQVSSYSAYAESGPAICRDPLHWDGSVRSGCRDAGLLIEKIQAHPRYCAHRRPRLRRAAGCLLRIFGHPLHQAGPARYSQMSGLAKAASRALSTMAMTA
jgi:hypothetical protein